MLSNTKGSAWPEKHTVLSAPLKVVALAFPRSQTIGYSLIALELRPFPVTKGHISIELWIPS